MSKNKSSSISMWDDFSDKMESLREALNTPTEENDSPDTPHVESESLYHFTENDALSLDTFDIESLRKALNTPIDEIIEADRLSAEADVPSRNDDDGIDLDISDNMNIESDDIESSNTPGILSETVEETETFEETDLGEIGDPNNQTHKTEESGNLDNPQESHDVKEDTVTNNEQALENVPDPNNQIQKTDESDNLDDTQESHDVNDATVINYEPVLQDILDLNNQTQKADESDNLDNPQEIQDIKEDNVTNDEPALEDELDPNHQTQKTDESDNLDDTQESQNIEIKIKTEQSLKSEKLDNYWREGKTTNPFLQKVDKSREELNKSLEIAREMVNQQSEEPPKQEKKRFQLKFARGEKNETQKSNTAKRKHAKDSTRLKPMVYEMLELKQDNQSNQDNQVNDVIQDIKGKQEKGRKEKTKRLDDRAKNIQEKEILNHRNRLEKSRSLGVPVFVKKPVNLEQIRQLKSTLISESSLKILVDTGSSQGRLLVISGQDPDSLLTTLSQLSIVKSTSVEDETINLVIQT